jgi:penicillin-binding protein 1B
MQPVPALVLGSFEVTPLELVSAYATLANGGERVTPSPVRVVVDRDGAIAAEPAPGRVAAVRPDEAYLLTYLLRGVMERGTGASARGLGVDGPVAGKTGTTNDGRDAWFVGFTPRLVTLVWVGFDEQDVIRLSGSQAALTIWADFMKSAMSIVPGGAFMVPTSIVFRDVDPSNGKLANRYCPVVFREAFLASTEPSEVCSDHGGSFQYFEGLFKRLLDAFGKPRTDSR